MSDRRVDVCANCAAVASDAVNLKYCTACRLVKYCGVDCQRAHRKEHKKACKQRAAELKDERLYSQGHERPEGDFCPICTLPIPFPMGKNSGSTVCCLKMICNGCNIAAQKRGMHDCPFCRTPLPKNDADMLAMVRARVAKKDPDAIKFLGDQFYGGNLGLGKDVPRAMELCTQAAKLGSIDAQYSLGIRYCRGEEVSEDMAQSVRYFEMTAIQGHAEARHCLGVYEDRNGNFERAVRHFLISAKMGYDDSLETIKRMYAAGLVSKRQFAEALKGYQDAVEEMKSPERDEVRAYEIYLERVRKDK